MKTLFVVCQHGNEQLPWRLVRQYKTINYLLANPQAVKKNTRFIETDLNRSFPGKKTGSYEECLARKILKKLKTYDWVIDLHTATCRTPLFAIITKLSQEHLKLIKRLGIKRVVYMKKSIASNKALIDHIKCGVSIECGNERAKKTQKDIERVLRNFITPKIKKREMEFYLVYKILKKSKKRKSLPPKIKNFHKTKLDGQIFYPILAREKNYRDVLCMMAKKTTWEKLYK